MPDEQEEPRLIFELTAQIQMIQMLSLILFLLFKDEISAKVKDIAHKVHGYK